ncbi:Arf GTPase activating protein [Kalmanozyma brasiliensis GHG001]|uniref:Arf GTPase activating protein n=1 Tax=Kalmanozyma brasiliensis (strain GHG001) TaxID=1365824 RepID=UPI0028680794|nr:Arf GTPase activating protein [Kalmanozyma brasiliensis GHG001]EST05321.2 Arf GTPase activating protein [Kalmanozyma brasiliensis GHG001]
MNSKAAQERQQRVLIDLVRQPGNDVCADCKGRAPRWASWNLGIFICVQCAGVHRKMGVHISKVKSITLDTWTREQVDRMKEVGNLKSNRKYNPDEMRNRPPTNMEESERDSELEKYIRRKYEFRRFMAGQAPPVPTKDATFLTSPPSSIGRSRSPNPSPPSSSRIPYAEGSSIERSRTAPIPTTWREAQQRAKANAPPLPSPAATTFRAVSGPQTNGAAASLSVAVAAAAAAAAAATTQPTLQLPATTVPLRTSSALNARNGQAAASASKPSTGSAQSSVFDDLISLSGPTQSTAAQPPLQMNPWAAMQAQQQAVLSAPAIQEPSGNFWAGSSATNGAPSPTYFGMSSSPNGNAFGQMRNVPQHSNTAPTLGLGTPQQPMMPQSTGMLSPGNGMMFPQYQQQRSASLGTMAFSTSPLPSPGFVSSNPFNTTPSPQPPTFMAADGPFQQQPQQLGQAAFQGQTSMFGMNGQQQQQVGNGVGSFQSSMMPSSFGQSPHFGGQSMQQQQQQYQQGSQFGNMW